MNLNKLTTLLFVSLLFGTTAIAQERSTAQKDTTDSIDKVILDRITVVGAPAWISNIPGSASYVSPEQLQRQSYTDINRILRTVSGVNIQEEEGFGLRPNIGLRGAGVERSSKINLMEDGVLAAPAPYAAPAAYYFPNMGRISSVEVRKGSSQIKYGPNTTGGAINVISTPIPTERSGRAEVSIGERYSNKLYANYGNRTERFGYMIEAMQIGDNGFKNLDNGDDTGFLVRDFVGKFMVRSAPEASTFQRLELKLGYNDQVSDETYLGLTREDFAVSPFRRYAGSQTDQMNTEHKSIMARHFVMFNSNIDVTTTLYHNDFARGWYKLGSVNGTGISSVLNDPASYANELDILRGQNSADDALNVRSNNREYFSQGVESILALNFSDGSISNEIELGVRLHRDEEDRFQYEDLYRMENGAMILTSAGAPGTQANRVGSATALSIYLKDDIVMDRWTFTPGVRLENIWFSNKNYGTNDPDRTGSSLSENEYTVTELIPGAGVTFKASDQITLIAGIHKGFSPPSPGSSPETESESSVNYELGFRLADDLIRTEIIGFYSDYSNLLGSDLEAGGGGGTSAQFNAGSVEVVGLEVSAETDFAEMFGTTSLSIPFNINYTYTKAEFRTSFDSSFGPWGTVQEGDQLPFIPEHQLNMALSLNWDRVQFNINNVFSPKMRTVAGQGDIEDQNSTDSYFITDVNATYNVMNNIDLFVNARNLLNETYIVSDRPAGVRPGLPRTFMGGFRVNL
ncbi:TonB-dependent receptor family protein [Rhodohalobacter halophilus]|uniref:TonB-dependent receptor family protein n=1 Tax=Rhodohalobacter halophilus TaxID=1812810 RepID=UPI00083F5FFD|nr:TonB-dependent receptor [Rhodohalobacter halophilus]